MVQMRKGHYFRIEIMAFEQGSKETDGVGERVFQAVGGVSKASRQVSCENCIVMPGMQGTCVGVACGGVEVGGWHHSEL